MKKILFLILSLPYLLFGQAPGCPNIQVDNETVTCDAPCVDLIATFLETGATTEYEVDSIEYNPPYPFDGGTIAFLGTDDFFTDIITVPFDFCFYGNTYNQLVIGANGLITFDISLATQSSGYAFSASIPSAPTLVNPYENSINGAFLDIDPSIGGDINYATLGTAPCRTFVVNFNEVPSFSCNDLLVTQQIVIYETTNAIEVYIQDKPTCTTWNSGNAVIGIQNIGATQGLCPPNRNTGSWAASQEAWRFTPSGTPNYIVEWFDINGNSLLLGDTLNICTQTQENYTAEITYTNCNGSSVTESITSTVFIDGTAGQIDNLGLVDTIESCISPVTINAGAQFDSYQWNTGDTTQSITAYNSGNFILEATQSGCNGDDTVYVSIVNANILENDTTICNLESLTLNLEETNTIILWSTNETNENIIVSPSQSNEYWVEISDGITTCRDSIQININQLPSVSFNGPDEICQNDSSSLNIIFTGNQPFIIDLNGESKTFTNFNNLLNISPVLTTTYNINSISDVFCSNDTVKTHTVIVNTLPSPEITPQFSEIYAGEYVSLTSGEYSYYWWYDENDNLISENEILIVDSNLSTYIIVESNSGCYGKSTSAIVQELLRVDFFIPNTFTPNGDEHNDLLVTMGKNISSFNMIITNRWGEVMYTTKDINKFWDGKFNQNPVVQGAYTYQVDILGKDKRAFITNGIIKVLY